jgi:hypothetical protein
MNKTAKTLLAAALFAVTAVGAPAFAKNIEQGPVTGTNTQGPPLSRDDALRDCNQQASKWGNMTWENEQETAYRSCMAGHEQQE